MSDRWLKFAFAILTFIILLTTPAFAERPYIDGPMVKSKPLLYEGRFEITPLFEMSIDPIYYYTLSGGLKFDYGLYEWLSIGALGLGGFSLGNGVVQEINAAPSASPSDVRSVRNSGSSLSDFTNTMPIHGAIYASVRPLYGKMSWDDYSISYINAYLSAGLSIAQLSNVCLSCQGTDNNNPYDDIPTNVTENDNITALASAGVRLGLYVGAGLQIFLTKNIALDLFLRNYIFEDNPTGFDLNNDLSITAEDNQYYHHLFAGIGLSILLPQNDF